MPLVDLVMPKMGESIMEATILKWHKQPGDAVKQDETVLEIATDKVDSEVPSVTEGVVEELLFNVNDVVPIGSVIARIRTNGAAAGTTAATAATPVANGSPVQAAAQTQQTTPPVQPAVAATAPRATPVAANGPRFYSPLVLNIAAN